jgi:hypothetical protein
MAQDMLRWRNDAASVDVSRFGGSIEHDYCSILAFFFVLETSEIPKR